MARLVARRRGAPPPSGGAIVATLNRRLRPLLALPLLTALTLPNIERDSPKETFFLVALAAAVAGLSVYAWSSAAARLGPTPAGSDAPAPLRLGRERAARVAAAVCRRRALGRVRLLLLAPGDHQPPRAQHPHHRPRLLRQHLLAVDPRPPAGVLVHQGGLPRLGALRPDPGRCCRRSISSIRAPSSSSCSSRCCSAPAWCPCTCSPARGSSRGAGRGARGDVRACTRRSTAPTCTSSTRCRW